EVRPDRDHGNLDDVAAPGPSGIESLVPGRAAVVTVGQAGMVYRPAAGSLPFADGHGVEHHPPADGNAARRDQGDFALAARIVPGCQQLPGMARPVSDHALEGQTIRWVRV